MNDPTRRLQLSEPAALELRKLLGDAQDHGLLGGSPENSDTPVRGGFDKNHLSKQGEYLLTPSSERDPKTLQAFLDFLANPVEGE